MIDKQFDFFQAKIAELSERFTSRIDIVSHSEEETKILYKLKTNLPGLVHHLDIEMVCWQMANSFNGKLIICEEVG